MNPLSIIGTGVAFANYRKAKNTLDALVEKKEALEAAVKSYYEGQRYDMMNEVLDVTIKDNTVTYPDGVKVSSILRVGNLVGKLMRAKISLVVTNTSANTYVISNPSVSCFILGVGVGLKDGDMPQESIVLKPGQTIEISSKNSIAGFEDESMMAKLRDLICKEAGKKLITSCPKLNVSDAETADIYFEWTTEGNKEQKVATWLKVPGVLRYCMEAFYG